jgi:hypothetical protein
MTSNPPLPVEVVDQVSVSLVDHPVSVPLVDTVEVPVDPHVPDAVPVPVSVAGGVTVVPPSLHAAIARRSPAETRVSGLSDLNGVNGRTREIEVESCMVASRP